MGSEIEIIVDDYTVAAFEEFNRKRDQMCLVLWIKDKNGRVLDCDVHYQRSVHDIEKMARTFLRRSRDRVDIQSKHEGLQQHLNLAIETLELVAESECEFTDKVKTVLDVLKSGDQKEPTRAEKMPELKTVR